MKKIASIVSVILLCVCLILPISVSAESNNGIEVDGLKVAFKTDKESYKKGDEIGFSLDLKNKTDDNMQNIRVELLLPEGVAPARGTRGEQRVDITANKGGTLDCALILTSDKIGNLNVDTSDATSTLNLPMVICLAVIGLFAAGTGVSLFFAIRNPKRLIKIISFAVSGVLVIGMVPAGIIAFSDRDVIMYVNESVEIDGKKVDVVAKVTKLEAKHSQDVVLDFGDAMYDTIDGVYYVFDDITKLKGNIFNDVHADSVEIQVLDCNEKILFKNKFSPKNKFEIPKFGLIAGVNTIKLKVTHDDGFIYTETFKVNNLCEENMKYLKVDRGDNDGDGLLNFTEVLYHTDKNNPDTDGDGLSDYVEMVQVGTDPLVKDTDSDGVLDADEDSDGDGLTNIDELEITKTDPSFADTDKDLISDYAEIRETKTDPNKADTDEDGKTDKWELDKGYDPVVPNKDFPKSEGESEIPTIQIESDGKASVEKYEGDLNIGDDIPGDIGVPPFSVDLEEGSEADITIDYDPEKLDGKKPSLYEYDPDTQEFNKVDDAVIGKDTVKFSTTKSSKYILLDGRYIEDVWQNDIFRPSQNTDGNIDIVFVIDRSASMDENDPNGLRKDVTKKFIEKLRADKDRAAIVQFTAIGETIVPMTEDKETLINAVDGIENSDGGGCAGSDSNAGTNGSAGIRNAITELEGSTADYKYIIFLTDGKDTSVSENYGDASGNTGLTREAKSKGIIIHTVGLVGTGEVDIALLKTVAAGTGGNFYNISVSAEGAELESQIYEVYDEIESVTVDRHLDSNNDGISDYYTRLIVEGKISTTSGISLLFGNAKFDDVQANADFDGDGLKNGQEIEICENEKGVYIKLHSYPFLVDSDDDGIKDPDEKKVTLSPIKYNTSANKFDIEWLVNDNNFESNKYLSAYLNNDFRQTAVFLGNTFFGSNVDMTAVYRKELVNMFTKIDVEITQLHKDENYRALVLAYYDGAIDAITEEMVKAFNNGDTEGVLDCLRGAYDMTSGLLDRTEALSEVGLLEMELPEAVANVAMQNKLIKPLDDYMDALKAQRDFIKTYAIDSDNVDDYLEYISNGLKDIEVFKSEQLSKIAVKAEKFNEVFGQVTFLIDSALTIYDACKQFTDSIAALETVKDNMYILKCITNTEDPFLNYAAIELYMAFEQAVNGHTKLLEDLAVRDATLSIAAEAVHEAIGATLQPVGTIIEAVRIVGDVFLDASDNAESAIGVITHANTSRWLAKNLNAHIMADYTEELNDILYAYSNYSKDFLISILNLAETRSIAEDNYAKWDCLQVTYVEQNKAKENLKRLSGIILNYNIKYEHYLSKYS